MSGGWSTEAALMSYARVPFAESHASAGPAGDKLSATAIRLLPLSLIAVSIL